MHILAKTFITTSLVLTISIFGQLLLPSGSVFAEYQYSSDLQLTDKLYANNDSNETIEQTNNWVYPLLKHDKIATNSVDLCNANTDEWDSRADSFAKARENGYYAVVQVLGKNSNYAITNVYWTETKTTAKIKYTEPNYGVWQIDGAVNRTTIKRCGEKITAYGFDKNVGYQFISSDPTNNFPDNYKLFMTTFPVEYPDGYSGAPAPNTALPSDTQGNPPNAEEQECNTDNVFTNLACNISNMGAKIVKALQWFFVPDMDDIGERFNKLISTMSDKLGFIAQPFTIIPQFLNQVYDANDANCQFDFFGKTDNICSTIRNAPMYSVMTTIMRIGAVIGLLAMLRAKFMEATSE